jgi:hypothetical protein
MLRHGPIFVVIPRSNRLLPASFLRENANMGELGIFALVGLALASGGCSDSCSVNLAGNYTIAGCASGSCTITQQMGQCSFSASCDSGITCTGKVSGSSSVTLSCNTGFGTYSGSGSINTSGMWSVRLSGSSGTSCNVVVTPVPGRDAGMPDGPPPDAAPLCTSANQRVCPSSSQSGHCDSMLNAVADRTCPGGSTCMGGYCQPPSGAAACTSTNNCNATLVCAIYSNPTHTGLVGFCSTPRPGGAGLYANCTRDLDCGSDFCAMRSGGLLECAEPCSSTSVTCPGAANNCNAIASPTTIEGIPTAGQRACLQ